MPIHDWTRPTAGRFHHFHQAWTVELCRALNRGILPDGYEAFIEQRGLGFVPDLMTEAAVPRPPLPRGSPTLLRTPPKTRFVSRRSDAEVYAARTNRIAVRTPDGELVSMIELVSPGNKASRNPIRAFRNKVVDYLRKGVHVSIIDLLPPTPRDPQGIHKIIWDQIRDEPFDLPAGKSLTLAAYVAEPVLAAYVEWVGVDDILPPLSIFLDDEVYVSAPLEESYTQAWNDLPQSLKAVVGDPPA